jgi:hypothetical protein
MDIAIATCKNLPEPDFDAEPLADALHSACLRTEFLAWDDPAVDWSRADMTLLRSTWNYPLYPERFTGWLEIAAAGSSLWNPLEVVRWNIHKSYLLDLERKGVPISPTALVRKGAETSLLSILNERGWNDVVVKPAISAASLRTRLVRRNELDQGESHLRSLVADGDALVQLYLPSVEEYGERALVWVDGELTHAVRKSPRFDGEDEAVSQAMPISPAEQNLAAQAIDAVVGDLLYARVDVAPGPAGDPVVMELELIEPSLFFPQEPAALRRLVAGIQHRL